MVSMGNDAGLSSQNNLKWELGTPVSVLPAMMVSFRWTPGQLRKGTETRRLGQRAVSAGAVDGGGIPSAPPPHCAAVSYAESMQSLRLTIRW